MNRINQYNITQELWTFDNSIKWWLVEEEDGSRYEMLTIRGVDERLMQRLIKGELKPLENRVIEGVQTLKEVSFSTEEQCYFILYEELEGYEFLHNYPDRGTSKSLLTIAQGLKQLKYENRRMHVIQPTTIRLDKEGTSKLCLIGLFELFKHKNLLDATVLSPNVQAWLKDRKNHLKPNFQDDIYALVQTFESVLRAIDGTISDTILKRALQEERHQRYAKYHELIADLEQLPVPARKGEERRAVKVQTTPTHQAQLADLLEDMNVKTYLKLDSERDNKKQIRGSFSTAVWNGKFVVDQNNHLFIPYFNEGSNERVLTNRQAFVGDFDYGIYSSNYKIVRFFDEKFDAINQLANLNKTREELIKQWRTLPEKEREYIEEQAFKAKYTKVEEKDGGNRMEFYLEKGDKKIWTKVKELKNERVVLFINEQKIGIILNYKPNEGIITIADPYCSIDEIQPKGELVEDVSQETSQFKKQVESCDLFLKTDVVNPAICDILATPDTTAMPYCSMLSEEEYEDFDELIFNSNIKNDTTQKEAVLEAMSYKPVYLIQGPPGTGKTTVIVELIQQIVRQQKDAKILVTSQSNLAVDNVLEKIAHINESEEGQNLLFMRLASEYSVDNIREKVQPHTFEKKLKQWVNNTTEQSAENLSRIFPKSSKNKAWNQLYDYCRQHSWDKFIQHLQMRPQHFKRRFQKINSRKEALQVFERELDAEYLAFRQIHKDWLAFLGGVMEDDPTNKKRKRSMLNDGSAEVDFLTAMMREMNIIGATCIHIASSKYSNINFRFDYVIMDESSKASPSETLVPINMGKNIILIGDHKQLPPVVTREEAVKKKVKEKLEDNGLDFDKDFGVSLFETLVNAFEKDASKQQFIKMLDIQYRMPKQVGALISKYFYENKLHNPKESLLPHYDASKAHELPLKVESSILFISTSKEELPYDNDNKWKRSNNCNVQKIQTILETLNALYADNLQRSEPLTIGIIAGYRGQVELLKDRIKRENYPNFILKKEHKTKGEGTQHLITINTVDKFQGAEEDIIIYDVVRSSMGPSTIGFLDDYRRINVAFSRVKKLLLVVGDADYLTKRATLHPNSRFKEFKLQQITQELKDQGLVFDSLKDALK